MLKVNDLTDETSVERELMLIKVKAEPGRRSEIRWRLPFAKIIDISPDSMIIEVTDENKSCRHIIIQVGVKSYRRQCFLAQKQSYKELRA